jgi:hypothetical protein
MQLLGFLRQVRDTCSGRGLMTGDKQTIAEADPYLPDAERTGVRAA